MVMLEGITYLSHYGVSSAALSSVSGRVFRMSAASNHPRRAVDTP